ncbi:GNAT family N-acetyltransferase [Flavobacterium aquidurense]|uniref:GNAT family N-acetyltransferase n=1 Tax=Flavobacterium aquidurense TaxID=362413 RepID=UPI00285969F1|nr:GNAT family N-acetyltransferase [Flavobacterium aquidurense]MDR7371596.1 GNAT superfamily N-acetyltransferase [Flavobacterium aquidurense]
MFIEKAIPQDHQVLTEITKKSKAFWGYSDEQIEIWADALTVSEKYIEVNSVYKLVFEDKIAGYYSFYFKDEKTVKLDNLFISPEYIGKGLGRIAMNHFLMIARKLGINTITLNADPNAETFYTKFDFVKVGQITTKIKDRYLPIMELNIKSEKN